MSPPAQHKAGIGNRILVYGSSCSGKSTLGEKLAAQKGCPFVELDALNWLPEWVGLDRTDPERLMQRFNDATQGDRWVTAGSYTRYAQATFWPRLDTVIFLDLPRWRLIVRVIGRSWRRWRTKELLWGTNHENFWSQFAIWRREESLIWWIWTNFDKRRKQVEDAKCDPRWQHIRFIHLRGTVEIEGFMVRTRLV